MTDAISHKPAESNVRKEKQRKRLIWFGAFLLMATFLVKDELRERLRSLTDTIAEAQSAFALHQDTTHVFSALVYVSREVATVERELPRQKSQQDEWQEQFEKERGFILLFQVESSLTGLSQLITALPNNGDLDKQNAALQNEIHEFSRNPHEEVAQEVRLLGKAKELGLSVFKQAEARKVVYERWYRVSRWVSYILFGIGWILGVTGKLYGIDGLG